MLARIGYIRPFESGRLFILSDKLKALEKEKFLGKEKILPIFLKEEEKVNQRKENEKYLKEADRLSLQ